MAEAESSTTASKHLSGAAPNDRPRDILDAARDLIAYKARSKTTAMQHLADLEKRGHEVTVALLGDSMIERMTTTGGCKSLQSWPSEHMASDWAIETMNTERGDADAAAIARLPGVANFGCGGDKIQNVLYRVVGCQEADLKGLAEELQPSTGRPPNLKLWVIQVGTNNLHRKHGLKEADLNAFTILLKVLYCLSPGTKLLVTGLFYREDIPDHLVDRANVALRNIVAGLDQDLGSSATSPNPDSGISRNQTQSTGQSVDHIGMPASAGPSSSHDQSPPWGRDTGTFRFLPALQKHEFDGCLEDNVHLCKKGYQRWMKKLLPKVDEMLQVPRLPGVPRPSTENGQESTA